jgi:Ala-tRNA(Pro) deacylase
MLKKKKINLKRKIEKFLEEKEIKYAPIEHRTVYTAYDKAATLKMPLRTIGKTLVVKFNRECGLVLIRADRLLDRVKFKKVVNKWLRTQTKKAIKTVDFVKESWIKNNLKGVKVGAIPPFGEMWKLPTFIDKSLLRNKKIIVNAGDYTLSIQISPANLRKTESLIEASFSKIRPKPKKKTKKKTNKRKKK